MNLQRFYAAFITRNREFWRDHASLAWNFAFPIFIVVGFAIAFSGQERSVFTIGFQGDAPAAYSETRFIRWVEQADVAQAKDKIAHHRLDLLIDFEKQIYWINEQSPNGYLSEKTLYEAGLHTFSRETANGDELRYIDWLIPGLLGMNLMFSALFGIGYVVVRYRKNGVLKRLNATPLTAVEFLSAQVVSRLWLIVAVSSIIFIGTDLMLNFAMFGSYWLLLLILILAAASLISMGLVVAARVRSEELAGGLLNFVSWPMMFFSGIWFSLEGLNPLLQNAALIFPLTHALEAARAVMLDGEGIAVIWPELAILAGFTVFFLVLGAALFRWE